MSALPPEIRKIIVQEIYSWEKEGLLSAQQARAILPRYIDIPTAPQPAPAAPAAVAPSAAPALSQPQPTLTQTLLSETSIKIALYLGAFFVIGAALIFAALVELLRLPILLSVSVLFFAGALLLKKRLPQPSFVLFLVFSMLILISGNVLAQSIQLSGHILTAYWIVMLFCVAILWAFSTWLYRSRFFSLLCFAAIAVAAWLCIALIDGAQPDLYLLALAVSTFLALLGTRLLKSWQGQDFAVPLFALGHAVELGLLAAAFVVEGLQFLDAGVAATGWWVGVLTWGLAAIFYVISDLLIPLALFPVMTAGALLLMPWLVLSTLKPQNNVYAFGWASWGALYALAGEGFRLIKQPKLKQYGLPFSLGALALLGLGALVGWVDNVTLGFGLFLGAAVLLAVLHALAPRWWLWSTALLFGLFAYYLGFHLPGMPAIQGYPVYQFVGATALLLLPDLVLKADLGANKPWRWPLRIYAALLVVSTTALSLAAGVDEATKATLAFGVLAVLALIFALRYGRRTDGPSDLGFLFTGYLSLVVVYAVRLSGAGYWLWPLIGLAAAYYMAGVLLTQTKQSADWQRVFMWSGLALATLTALSAPLENTGLEASLPVALAATLWAVHAFQKRSVWLAFPANLLYLMSYFMLLLALHVDQPQFYSVGAALLGMLMHYLLTRSGSQTGAFLTGMLSQLVLLGTTYLQMFSSSQLAFFVALFLQSLVVLLYGIVIRSRSLVGMPIVFVVLGVVTVVFTFLSGISLVILIGCSGVLLIFLGILAVLLRERIAGIGQQWSGWNA